MKQDIQRRQRGKSNTASYKTSNLKTHERRWSPNMRKQLRQFGKGGHANNMNKALGLNRDALEKFRADKQLADHSPDALSRTIWYKQRIKFTVSICLMGFINMSRNARASQKRIKNTQILEHFVLSLQFVWIVTFLTYRL